MFNFFRKIRRLLINQGNLKKYFTYALGEILLVVTGILIALAVNNWWQNRLKKVEEVKVLKEIKESLEYDKLDILFNINAYKIANRCIDTILSVMEQDRPFRQSLGKYFAGTLITTRFIAREGSFDVLKSKGIELISNDSIKKAIVAMYDARYQYINELQFGLNLPDNVLSLFCLDHFDIVETYTSTEDSTYLPGSMVPHDFEKLKKNRQYRTLLKSIHSQNMNLLFYYRKNVSEPIENLISDLEAEIKRLNKNL